MNIKKISENISTVLKDENLRDIATEFTEVFVDRNLIEGVLKELPGTNILIGAFKAYTSVQDALFINKLSAFLKEIKDIPLKEREEMIAEIDASPKNRIKLGEKLLYIVDKCDDPDKAQLTAILFKSIAKKAMDYDSFVRCAQVIQRCILSELKEFVLEDKLNYTIESYSDYLIWGLLGFEPFSIELEELSANNEFNGKEYKLHKNDLGLRLSWEGKKIRENLREFVKSNDDTFNITTFAKIEIEHHLSEIFKIYLKEEHRHKLENVIKITLIQMMNNPKISTEDFFELAYTAIEKTEIEITVFNQHIKEHYNKLAALDIKFDFQFWLDFKEKYNARYLETLMKTFK